MGACSLATSGPGACNPLLLRAIRNAARASGAISLILMEKPSLASPCAAAIPSRFTSAAGLSTSVFWRLDCGLSLTTCARTIFCFALEFRLMKCTSSPMDAPSSKAPRIPPSRVPSTPGTSAPDFSLLFHFGDCVSADVPGASERAAHVRTVEVFTQVHQRQERAQDSRLQVVRQVQAARRYARQAFSVFRDELHDFTLALLRRVAQRRLPPHLRAAGFQRKREVQHAQPLLGECRWRVVLASRNLARRSHVPMGLKD